MLIPGNLVLTTMNVLSLRSLCKEAMQTVRMFLWLCVKNYANNCWNTALRLCFAFLALKMLNRSNSCFQRHNERGTLNTGRSIIMSACLKGNRNEKSVKYLGMNLQSNILIYLKAIIILIFIYAHSSQFNTKLHFLHTCLFFTMKCFYSTQLCIL